MNTKEKRMGIVVLVTAFIATTTLAASWEPAPSLNEARQDFAAAVDEAGNIWAVGGWDRTSGCGTADGPVRNSVEVLYFDGQGYASAWAMTEITPPVARLYHCAVVSNGFLYLVGGWGPALTSPPILAVDRYDTLTGSWSSTAVPSLPAPRIGSVAVADPVGRIWVIGGAQSTTGNPVATVIIFDPARPELGWVSKPTMHEARKLCGTAVDRSGLICVTGGYTSFNPSLPNSRTMERIDPLRGGAWVLDESLLPEPVAVESSSAIGADGQIYVIGGWTGYWTGRVSRFNPRCDSQGWVTYQALNLVRDAHRVVLGHDGYVYAIAGNSYGCLSVNSVERLFTGQEPGDINDDGVVDFGDINPFVELLSGAGCW